MGDRRADFAEYATARRPHLRRLAYALCGDWHLADDIVQVSLSRAYVAWPRIRKRGAEDAYVRQTLSRVAIDESRRPWRRENPGLEAYDVPSREGLEYPERSALIDALQELPIMQRRAVVLRYWWGLSIAEAADDLGISEGTVKSHCSRGLDRLNHLMTVKEGAEE